MTTGIGNEWDPGDSPEIHKEAEVTLNDPQHPDGPVYDEIYRNMPKLELKEDLPQRESTKIYTRAQVCEILGMNHSTLARWEQKKLISEAQRINNMCVYSEEQLQEIKQVWEASTRNIKQEEVCSSCHRRKARKNSTLCSRCSYTQLETQLRSTLPGMVKDVSSDSSVSGVSSVLDGQEEPETCPSCGSDDPFDKKDIKSGPEEFPIVLTCTDDWHRRNMHVSSGNIISGLEPGKKYYNRRQLAEILQVSPTTICRWEQRGHIPPSLRVVHNNQAMYTEEHLTKAQEYKNLVEQLKSSPVAQAAKSVSSKTFSKLAEKTVAVKLSAGGFRRGTLL